MTPSGSQAPEGTGINKRYEVILTREIEEFVSYTIEAENEAEAETRAEAHHDSLDPDTIVWQAGDTIGMTSVGDAEEVTE